MRELNIHTLKVTRAEPHGEVVELVEFADESTQAGAPRPTLTITAVGRNEDGAPVEFHAKTVDLTGVTSIELDVASEIELEETEEVGSDE
jgi:hypothetical protein